MFNEKVGFELPAVGSWHSFFNYFILIFSNHGVIMIQILLAVHITGKHHNAMIYVREQAGELTMSTITVCSGM